MANRWKIRCRNCRDLLPGDTKEIMLFCKCITVKVKGNSWSTRVIANRSDFDVITDRKVA